MTEGPTHKIIWEAFEYNHTEKGQDWFWAVGIISLAIAVTAVIFQNYLFAVLIIVSAITLSLYATRKPEIVHCEVNTKGIIMHKTMYLYAHLSAFWVEDQYGETKILVRSEKLLSPLIVVPIEDADHEEVRMFLRRYLPEEEIHEPLGQKVMEYFGF
jgi:hypothetical protein